MRDNAGNMIRAGSGEGIQVGDKYIYGSTPLSEAAAILNISAETLMKHLGIPQSEDAKQKIKYFAEKYGNKGCSLEKIRELVQ